MRLHRHLCRPLRRPAPRIKPRQRVHPPELARLQQRRRAAARRGAVVDVEDVVGGEVVEMLAPHSRRRLP